MDPPPRTPPLLRIPHLGGSKVGIGIGGGVVREKEITTLRPKEPRPLGKDPHSEMPEGLLEIP